MRTVDVNGWGAKENGEENFESKSALAAGATRGGDGWTPGDDRAGLKKGTYIRAMDEELRITAFSPNE